MRQRNTQTITEKSANLGLYLKMETKNRILDEKDISEAYEKAKSKTKHNYFGVSPNLLSIELEKMIIDKLEKLETKSFFNDEKMMALNREFKKYAESIPLYLSEEDCVNRIINEDRFKIYSFYWAFVDLNKKLFEYEKKIKEISESSNEIEEKQST